MFQISYLCKSFLCLYDFTNSNIYFAKKNKKKNIQNNAQKMKYKMNNFNYINTLERKRNEQFSNKKVI